MTNQSRELDALRAFIQDAPPPTSETSNRIRRDILTRIAQSTRDVRPWYVRHRLAVTGAGISAATAAAAIVAIVVVGGDPQAPHEPDAPPVAAGSSVPINPAAQTLQLAADYAAAQPFTPPRSDQWAYIELKIVTPEMSEPVIRKSWYRLDGTQRAIPNSSGGIDIETNPGEEGRVGPRPALDPHDYAALVGMPSEPQAMLTFLRAGLQPIDDPELDRTGDLFGLIGYILRENVLPPNVTAALLNAAATIPGVTQLPGTDTVDGRPTIAVSHLDGWHREDILLDPGTLEFIGSRSVAVEDEPTAFEDPNFIVVNPAHKGDVLFLITRGVCNIVDAPGQTS